MANQIQENTVLIRQPYTKSQGIFVDNDTDTNDMTELISCFTFTQNVSNKAMGLLYSKLSKVIPTISNGINYMSFNEKMPLLEIQKDNRNKLDFTPIEANPIKQEQQAQTCQTQELEKQSKRDKVIEEQSVLSQVTRKPKLKTDALSNTNKQIIRPKFNHLPLQSINLYIFGSNMALSFQNMENYIACFDIYMILNTPMAKVKYKLYYCI